MKKYLKIIIACLIFLIGLIIGIFLKDIPYFTWSKEIQVDEVVNAFVALGLAIIIPFWITKWLEDNKGIKQFLLNEVSVVADELENIKSKIESCYKAEVITGGDKKEINSLFNHLDRRINSLSYQVNQAFPKVSKEDLKTLKDANSEFWREITGGDLMNTDFDKVSKDFLKSSLDAYFKFESEIKMLAHKINKY